MVRVIHLITLGSKVVGRSNEQLWARARRFIAGNQAAPARATLESLLAREPGDTAAHLILGALYAADDHQRAATHQSLAAAANPPEDPGLLTDLVAALLQVGEIIEARRLLDMPAIAHSDSVHVLMRAAAQRQLMGDHATALALVERARIAGATGRDFHFYRAIQLAFNGELETSRRELERCIAIDPPLGRAYVQLARTRRQSSDDNHLAAIDAALQRIEKGSEDHAALEFAHYKELEDLQRYEEAWQALVHGNALMHARLPYDTARERELFQHLAGICVPEFLRADRIAADAGPQPIFVIGMPRSGTTVLERILGNHSRITSAGELGDFPKAMAYAMDHRADDMLDETMLDRLEGVDWGEVGRRYLAQTRWRAGAKPLFVDKLPRNWMVAGMIHKALPNAPILHIVRDPMDVCFSNWRAYFGSGREYAYAYDLGSLAAHYRLYRQTMAHWKAAMPGVIFDVPYARLVCEPEAVIRDLLVFCGLDWEPDCMNLARNTTPSATLSMPQVRSSIHRQAFDEWRHYDTHLSSLAQSLS